MDYIGGKIMPFFNIVAASNENTVVTEYEPVNARSDNSFKNGARFEMRISGTIVVPGRKN